MKNNLKKFLAVILCIVMMLTCIPFGGMGSLIPKASAASISENDLFMIFPEYLDNIETDTLELKCISAVTQAFGSLSKPEEVLQAVTAILGDGIEIGFKTIGSRLGWSEDYETSMLKDSTLSLLLALTENDETLKSAVKSAEDVYKPLKTAYKLSTEAIRITTKATFINKWVDSYMRTTGLSRTQSVDILGADWDLAHKSSTMKYIKKVTTVADEVVTACDAAVAVMELSAIDIMLIDTLMQYIDKTSELYKGLLLVKADRVKSPEQYLVKTYFSEKGIKTIGKVLIKLAGEEVGTLQLICNTIASVLKKTVLSGRTISDQADGTNLLVFACVLDDAVDSLKTKFIEGTASSDQIQDFKILFSAYIAALSASCEAAYKFSRGKFRDAVDEYAAIMGDTYHYEAYIKSCTNNVSADITAGKISASGVYSAVSTTLNESSIKERLAKIKAKYPIGSKYTGSFGYSAGNSQAFAQQVFYMLYDRKISPMVGGYWHTLSKNTNVKKIGTLTGTEVTTGAVTDLLSQAKVGDLITAHNNYGVHMMTVTGVGSSGITVYDCDSRYNGNYSKHLVQEYVFSYASLASTFSRSRYYDNYSTEMPGGISLYRAHVQKRISTGSGRAIDYYTYDDSVNYIVTDGVLTGYTGSRSVLDIPDTVITIGASCFKNNKNITEVNMPDTVTTIEASAFNGCSNLRYVHFSSNLTTIKANAFYNCSSLLSVVLPDSVTFIGSWCFGHCSELSYVRLSKALETLSGVAFGYCTNLKSIEIPKSISSTNGESGPFTGCEKLSEITFEEGITEIHAYLFKDCPGITEITIPETVTTIGACAFYQCHNLLSVVFPSNLTKIGGRAFYHCDALLSVEIPDSVVSIGDWCFGNCSDLSFVKLSKNISVLSGCAFGDCDSIQCIEIPKSITTTNGPNGSFIRCKNLREIIFEEGITEIPAYLFQDCTGIVNITIPETVTKIGACAFKNCNNLVSIKLPNGLETIGNSAFSGCTALKGAEFNNDNAVLGENVFDACTSLETVRLPANMNTIPLRLFKDCSSLRTFNMPQKITKIGGQAFYNNDEMTAVTIPPTVTQIEYGAFYDCDKLRAVTMSNSVTSLGTSSSSYGCFQGCEVLENVTLSKGLTIIRQNTFADCPALKEIEIPHYLLGGVTTIEKNAFKNCVSLTKAIIPVTVTSIGSEAFSYPDKTVIYGCKGSYAETFANNGMNGKKFQFVDITKHITGMALKGHDDDKLTIAKGAYVVPDFDYLPADTTDIVTMSSNNTSVVRIQNVSQIYGYANGTTTVKATTSGGMIYDFTVYVHSVSNLTITSQPAKTVYKYGEELDISGLSVTATFSDGTTEIVSDYEVTGYSPTTYGEQTLTVKYAGKTVPFKVTVVDNRVKVTSIAVTTLPKTAYEKGEAFDETGMVVTATYTDDTTAPVSGYSISAMNSLKLGKQTLTVTYIDPVSEQTFTTNFEVTVVIVVPTLSSIAVKTMPKKTSYAVGESFDQTGLTLTATYSDGNTKVITSGFTCSGFSSYTVGTKTITVSYDGKTTTFTINVVPSQYTLTFNANGGSGGPGSQTGSGTITLSSGQPSRTGYTFLGWATSSTATSAQYQSGGSYNLTGNATLYAVWKAITYSVKFNGNGATSGSMSNQTFTYDVSQNLTANAFKRAFTVSYNYNGATGGNSASSVTATSTFNGWATSASGAKVYSDKASVKNLLTTSGTYNLYANWTAGTVTLPTPTKAGSTFAGWYTNASLTNYAGAAGAKYTPTANTTLYAKWTSASLSSVTVKTKPAKTTYTIGESFDQTGLTLTATYSDGSTKTITSGFTCTGFNSSASGTQSIIVSYTEGGVTKKTSFTVTVVKLTLTGIAVKTNPTKTQYYIGESFDQSGLTLTATYSNGSTKTITSGFACTGFSSSSAGTKTVTVSYTEGGVTKKTSFTVTVIVKTLYSLSVTTKPSKTIYTVGETLDTSGMVVRATYSDGSTANITGYTCSPTQLPIPMAALLTSPATHARPRS